MPTIFLWSLSKTPFSFRSCYSTVTANNKTEILTFHEVQDCGSPVFGFVFDFVSDFDEERGIRRRVQALRS